MKRKRNLDNNDILSLVIYCPNLDKKINVKWEDVSIVGWSSDPSDDYAPYQSGWDMEMTCKCGQRHRITS